MFKTTIKVNDVTYQLVITDQYDSFIKNDGLFGEIVYDTLTIYIKDSLCDESKRRVMIHELCHALLNSQGRLYSNSFDREDLCEMFAWNAETLINLRDKVWKEYTESIYYESK